ncbi:MAG: nitroreductase, partial [Desulfobacterales bacterium]
MEVFKGRRSIRKFKPDPVPRALIEEILSESRWCPSWANTQPWEVMVVQGAALEKFNTGQIAKLAAQASQQTDIPTPQKFPAKWHQRVSEVGKSCLAAEGIGKDDHDKKNKYFTRMFTLFGAPVMLLFMLDDQLELPYGMMDMGIFIAGVCLIAEEKGLGTLVLSTVIRYTDLLRSILPIPENKKVLMGMAMGYADKDASVNRFERKRIPVEEFVTWM